MAMTTAMAIDRSGRDHGDGKRPLAMASDYGHGHSPRPWQIVSAIRGQWPWPMATGMVKSGHGYPWLLQWPASRPEPVAMFDLLAFLLPRLFAVLLACLLLISLNNVYVEGSSISLLKDR